MTTIAPAAPLTHTATVGMVGGGQLARMTQQAAIGLGIDLRVLTPDAGDPAVRAGAQHHPGAADDLEALRALAACCDVVTFDHELIPNAHLHTLAEAGVAVRPNPHAKALAQDKVLARSALRGAGYAVPHFVEVPSGDVAAVRAFADQRGWPVVLKAPSGGYDGRGVQVLHGPDDVPAVQASGGRWLLEAHVSIATELAVLVARRPSGSWVTYPVIETVQRDGICHELVMPARIPDHVAAEATATAVSIADGIDATGILAVELFLTTDGALVVNELAARPHNSGHATIDAAVTSQFENHLRGVLDWPLGATTLHAPAAATVNLLGPPGPVDLARGLPHALEDPMLNVHLYGKASAPGRKIGHVTALSADPAAALATARAAATALVAR